MRPASLWHSWIASARWPSFRAELDFAPGFVEECPGNQALDHHPRMMDSFVRNLGTLTRSCPLPGAVVASGGGVLFLEAPCSTRLMP